MIAAPRISDKTSLHKSIYPQGWEHLSGGFEWCELIPGEELYEHPTYGLALRVKILTTRFGAIARQLSRTGNTKPRAILFAGRKGIGKTGAIELLGRTFLAKERVPVTYQLDSGEVVTLIDIATEDAIRLNPKDGGTDLVRKALANQAWVEGSGSNARIVGGNLNVMCFNADKLNVDGVRALGSNIKAPTIMADTRRLFIINEIDQIKSSQTAALKQDLDKRTMPDHVLVLADTNHLGKTRHNLGEADDRFEIIPIAPWSEDQLLDRAEVYIAQLGITFAPTFENPLEAIVQRCQGSIRQLLNFLEELADVGRPITIDDFQSIAEDEEILVQDVSQAAMQFLHNIRDRGKTDLPTLLNLVRRQIQRQSSLVAFATSISEALIHEYPRVLEDNFAQQAMKEIRDVAKSPGFEMTIALDWVSVIQPLQLLARRIKDEIDRQNGLRKARNAA